MKYLVTGATGTNGRKVVKLLLAAGEQVRAAVRDPDKAKDLADAGAEVMKFDFADAASIPKIFDGIDSAFLLTPLPGPGQDPVSDAIAAAKAAGTKHLVRLSALGAEPDSDLALARAHAANDQKLKDSGLSWTVIQPTFFMDNFVNFSGDTIRADGAFYGAAGDGKTAYVSSDDIAAVITETLRAPDAHNGKVYVLTGPEALDNNAAADIIGKALGKPVKYADLEPEQLAAGMKSQGVPDFMVETLVGLEAVKRNGWAEATTAAINDVTGNEPQTLAAFMQANKARLA